jgi:23S rRNA pseudouridine1911/1915/1917 synthase
MIDKFEDDKFEEDDEADKNICASESGLYEHYRFEADRNQALLRVDKFLCDKIANISRNRLQTAADAGCVHANGKPVKCNYRVKPADVITIMMSRPRQEFDVIPEDIPLNIVYEDAELLVVNKPAGLVVHPGHGNYEGTLVNGLAYYLKDDPDYDASDPRVGLIHRIDKDTSGLLVIAKRPDAKTILSRQFFDKTTHRRYQAIVWGIPKNVEGRIEGNIGRDPRDRQKMTVFTDGDEGNDEGKPAVTHYRMIENLGYVSLLEFRLETGRTHQIRVHSKLIGHPVFNDEKYGGNLILKGLKTSNYNAFVNNCFEICPRQALHAMTLGFDHPRTGEKMYFEAPLPDDMQQLTDKWRNYFMNR